MCFAATGRCDANDGFSNHINATQMDAIMEKYNSYPLHAFYASVGANDQIRAQSEQLYTTLINSEQFSDDENSYQVIIENVKHHFESWCTSLYNCLELFF